MASSEDLLRQLDADISVLDQLHTLLHKEQEALQTTQVDVIQAIHPEKSACLDRLRDSARQKVHLLVQMGFRPDSGDTSGFIRGLGDERLTQRWHQAQESLKECQFANEVNGRVIAHLQRRVERLAEIIRGGASHPKLYGKAGQTTGLGGSMIVASA